MIISLPSPRFPVKLIAFDSMIEKSEDSEIYCTQSAVRRWTGPLAKQERRIMHITAAMRRHRQAFRRQSQYLLRLYNGVYVRLNRVRRLYDAPCANALRAE
jgi:hypothetical protein